MSPDVERWVVDRLEGRVAVLVSDDGSSAEVDRARLPEGAAEGTVVRVTRDDVGEIRWSEAVVDEEATTARLDEAREILGELKKRDPGGDVVL